MLSLNQLHRHLASLKNGDEPAKREALKSFSAFESREWATIPKEEVRPLVDSLRRQLSDKSPGAEPRNLPRYRQEVATTLGKIGPLSEPAIPELIALLNNGAPDGVREAAVNALGNIGKPARGAVDDLLKVLSPTCRLSLAAGVARALGEIGCADQRVRSALLGLWSLSIRDETSRSRVALALCKLKVDAPDMIASLAEALVGSARLGVRQSAAEALSWCSKETVGVVPALLAAMYDEDETIRATATQGMERLGVKIVKAVQICCAQLGVCGLARTALARSGAPAVTALIATLDADDATQREKAAQTLGALVEPAVGAIPGLTGLLKDKEQNVRLAAAKALWNISKQPDPAVPALIELLRGKGFAADAGEARRAFLQTVIEALRRIGPLAKAASPALKLAATKDENRLVRESAVRALTAIDG